MRNKDLNKNINKAFDDMISSDFSAITNKISSGKGEILKMNEENKNEVKKERNKINLKQWVWVPAAGAVVMAVFMAVIIPQNQTIATVTLDVNPGIEMKINGKNEVKEITALNEDAKKIVETVDVKNDNIKTATDEIMQSMIDNNYISKEANAVLLTVDEASKEAEKIKEEFTKNIETYLNSKDIVPAIIGQIVTSSEELQKLAETNNISIGKAEIINSLLALNPEYTFEALAKLNTADLNLLIEERVDMIDDLDITGITNSAKYVGLSAATSAVLSTLGVSQDMLTDLETEIDFDNNKMIYEVEFKYNNKEYEYEIDALTGTVLSREIDGLDSTDIDDEIDLDDDNDNDDNDDDDDNDIDDNDNDDNDIDDNDNDDNEIDDNDNDDNDDDNDNDNDNNDDNDIDDDNDDDNDDDDNNDDNDDDNDDDDNNDDDNDD